MRRLNYLLLSLMLVVSLFPGCGPKSSIAGGQTTSSANAPRVIRTPPLESAKPLTVDQAQTLVKQFPHSASAYYLLGRAYYEHKQFKAAIPALDKAIRKDPLLLHAYYGLAHSYSHEQQWQQSKVAWRKLLQLSPSREHHYDALIGIGNIALDQHTATRENRWLSEAETVYQEAIQIDSSGFTAYYGLGIVAARKGDVARARSWFEQAVNRAQYPRDKAKSLEALANVYRDLGDQKQAEAFLQQAREADATYPATFWAK